MDLFLSAGQTAAPQARMRTAGTTAPLVLVHHAGTCGCSAGVAASLPNRSAPAPAAVTAHARHCKLKATVCTTTPTSPCRAVLLQVKARASTVIEKILSVWLHSQGGLPKKNRHGVAVWSTASPPRPLTPGN